SLYFLFSLLIAVRRARSSSTLFPYTTLFRSTTSFGQGVSVTPIQQVMAVSAAVNGGYLYEPYIAKEWIDPQTEEVVEKNEPKLKDRKSTRLNSSHVKISYAVF